MGIKFYFLNSAFLIGKVFGWDGEGRSWKQIGRDIRRIPGRWTYFMFWLGCASHRCENSSNGTLKICAFHCMQSILWLQNTFYFFIDFRDWGREREGEKEGGWNWRRERETLWPGMEPTTQAHALTNNHTDDLSVHWMSSNQLSHTGKGKKIISIFHTKKCVVIGKNNSSLVHTFLFDHLVHSIRIIWLNLHKTMDFWKAEAMPINIPLILYTKQSTWHMVANTYVCLEGRGWRWLNGCLISLPYTFTN